jgi:hypothetical protein
MGLAGTEPVSRVPRVPREYRALYDELAGHLADYAPGPPAGRPVYGAEIAFANSHRVGLLPDPMLPRALENNRLLLARLAELGCRGTTVTAHEDLFRPANPKAAKNRAFYRWLGGECRRRGLLVVAETAATHNPVGYATLPYLEYVGYRRAAAQALVDELAPDYLALCQEPDTEAAVTGYPQLATLAGYLAFVQAVAAGLAPGATRLGVGAGAWAAPEWVAGLQALGFAWWDVHVYPVNGPLLARGDAAMAGARARGQAVLVGEAWLYKLATAELRAVPPPVPPSIYRRDVYGFWAPLDQRLLTAVDGSARAAGAAYVSPFWAQYLFAALEYSGATRDLTFAEGQAQVQAAARAALAAGTRTPTGDFYAALAAAP